MGTLSSHRTTSDVCRYLGSVVVSTTRTGSRVSAAAPTIPSPNPMLRFRTTSSRCPTAYRIRRSRRFSLNKSIANRSYGMTRRTIFATLPSNSSRSRVSAMTVDTSRRKSSRSVRSRNCTGTLARGDRISTCPSPRRCSRCPRQYFQRFGRSRWPRYASRRQPPSPPDLRAF